MPAEAWKLLAPRRAPCYYIRFRRAAPVLVQARKEIDLRWQLPATIALLVWGLWAFLPKLALRTFDPRSVLVWESLGSVLVGLGVLVSVGFRVQTSPVGAVAAVITGICGLGGALFFLVALERGKASVVVPFTSLYPLITLALSVLFLGERPSATNLIGVLFAMAAVVLLSIGGK